MKWSALVAQDETAARLKSPGLNLEPNDGQLSAVYTIICRKFMPATDFNHKRWIWLMKQEIKVYLKDVFWDLCLLLNIFS